MITRNTFLKTMAGSAVMAMWPGGNSTAIESSAPPCNILWLSCEDMGTHLGCYGDPHAITPTLDTLAKEGIRYTRAFTTAGVCAPNRSSIITGVHAPTLGSHHMRSGGEGNRRSDKPALAPELKCFPEYLRAAGYYCTNNEKEDYNFTVETSPWDDSSRQAHWRNRPRPEQPFFAVFNYTGTHEGSIRATGKPFARTTERLRADQRQDPDKIVPLPFHPNTSDVRRQWANYYECITALDYWAADLLQQLDEDGLADNTIVFFWSDHGAGLSRCKRWVYDSGTHVPLLARIPEKRRHEGQGMPGTVEERLVSSVDFAPTVLNLAGLPIPSHMQGRPFLGENLPPERDYVYAARDRMDERYDCIRMVRDKNYHYIRNYEPFKPYDQYMDYEEASPVKKELHRLAKEGALPEGAAWVTRATKPLEELYDTGADPFELTNLADAPEWKPVLERLRAEHNRWFRASNDLGWIPEPELNTLANRYGSRYGILPGLDRDMPDVRDRLEKTVTLAGRPSAEDLATLTEALGSAEVSIRYWAAAGLGNATPMNNATTVALKGALEDPSGTVRVAAAKALLANGDAHDEAYTALIGALENPDEWIRLMAAQALDTAPEKPDTVLQALEKALGDQDNKYVTRVARHALGNT